MEHGPKKNPFFTVFKIVSLCSLISQGIIHGFLRKKIPHNKGTDI